MKRLETVPMVDALKTHFGLEQTDIAEGIYADVYYLKSEDLYVQLIEQHEGTDWNFCLRADFPATFDRWSVSLFEESFEPDDFDSVSKLLQTFYDEREETIKNELRDFDWGE